MSFGAWQSYQTGIHHKSTPSPELRQLLAAQCYGEAGEQSARHQVEQGGLAHLHHSQRHEGDEQTDAVRYRERGTEKQGGVNNANINIRELLEYTYLTLVLFLNCCLTLLNTNTWDNCP